MPDDDPESGRARASAPRGRRAADRRPLAELGRVESHVLSGDEPLRYQLFVPHGCEPRQLVVAVHGISRRPDHLIDAFASVAGQAEAVVVAPLFERPAFAAYQRLGWNGKGHRADLAMHRLVEKVAAQTGVAAGRVSLFGFSGGGQFAHRYTMAYPERVAACAVASAGWYTFPHPRRRYPYGLGDDGRGSAAEFGFDAARFLRVPLLVLVGENDLERDDALRTRRRLDAEQGRTRVERALSFTDAMRARARALGISARIELTVVEGAGHDFRGNVRVGLAERVFRFFFGNAITTRPPGVGAGRKES